MTATTINVGSIQRALDHHKTTGAVVAWTKDFEDRFDVLLNGDIGLDRLSAGETNVLCVGLAAGVRAGEKKLRSPQPPGIDPRLTVQKLIERLEALKPDARIFGYVGADGVLVQAETTEGTHRFLQVPMHIGGGGEAR